MKQKFKIFYISAYSEGKLRIEEIVVKAYKKVIDLIPDMSFSMSAWTNITSSANDNNEIIRGIGESDLVICNISKNNANLMYELGIVHALNKPSLLLVDNETKLNFDTSSIRYFIYDQHTTPNHIVNNLAKTITLIVSNPSEWTLDLLSNKKKADKKEPKTIFVSYNHKDAIYLERLKIHLKPLERNGLIDLWSDSLILSGEKWKLKIEKALEKAAIALLLVSADFMASDFIVNNELQPLLKYAEGKGTIIIPIVVKPCRFLRELSLSQFQAANDPINPLCKLTEFDQEEIYEKVSHRIELAIGSE
jgi:hypothetical protein